MASVEENRRYWDQVYSWSRGGEEWSDAWGGTEVLWKASVHPRIARFLPSPTILEVAPGHGRFTPFLMEHCRRYIGVDLSPSCIEVCRARFPGGEFHVNDGATLPMIESGSVDFVFSFFSLIHAEETTVASYLTEFSRILAPGAGGFVHHSNLHQHASYFGRVERLPKPLRMALHSLGLIDLPQWRAPSMSAQRFAALAREAGLAILSQETVNFGSRRTIDAFSSFVSADGPWKAEGGRWDHTGFIHEAQRARKRGQKASPTPLSPLMYGALQTKS